MITPRPAKRTKAILQTPKHHEFHKPVPKTFCIYKTSFAAILDFDVKFPHNHHKDFYNNTLTLKKTLR